MSHVSHFGLFRTTKQPADAHVKPGGLDIALKAFTKHLPAHNLSPHVPANQGVTPHVGFLVFD